MSVTGVNAERGRQPPRGCWDARAHAVAAPRCRRRRPCFNPRVAAVWRFTSKCRLSKHSYRAATRRGQQGAARPRSM